MYVLLCVKMMTSVISDQFRMLLHRTFKSTTKLLSVRKLKVTYVTPKGPGFLQQGKEEYVGLRLKLWHNRRCFSTSHSLWGVFGGKDGDQKQQTLEDVARLIKHNEYRRIVVMAGAGISTPSGIPDFRSPGSGLYDNLQQYDIPYPEAIFEINYFHHNPKPFFALAKELYPGNYKPNYAHYFIRLLHDKGLLHRIYTQNIDGLERLAGIPSTKLVEAHGMFATATCTVCQTSYPGEDLRADILESKVPKCPTCKGVIKPDVVFFGEELPQCFFLYLTDFPLADLLVVMGTSLEVEPFASLAGAVRNSVPRVLINRDLVGPFVYRAPRHNDVLELGDVVSGVERFADKLGWKEELNKLIAVETGKLKSIKKEE
ncbi:NAD-dependent protein deacetylase sirtuin-3-like isoform X1 [Acipenser ruthenus]|uniref:NAD-dependent protein deacetylase sirtuin-3-like isoform X1 n=2 Tax=Acipenser ruthenus TaxID=7906 RepID=UPI00274185AE|nr:NAD-dependent protein deacetylase sirtuin-3-like isoform X1 [Acipenser ruthenus]